MQPTRLTNAALQPLSVQCPRKNDEFTSRSRRTLTHSHADRVSFAPPFSQVVPHPRAEDRLRKASADHVMLPAPRLGRPASVNSLRREALDISKAWNRPEVAKLLESRRSMDVPRPSTATSQTAWHRLKEQENELRSEISSLSSQRRASRSSMRRLPTISASSSQANLGTFAALHTPAIAFRPEVAQPFGHNPRRPASSAVLRPPTPTWQDVALHLSDSQEDLALGRLGWYSLKHTPALSKRHLYRRTTGTVVLG